MTWSICVTPSSARSWTTRRRSPATAARSATGCGARRAADDQPLGQAGDRGAGRARARANGDLLAQGPLQSRIQSHIEISKSNLHAVPADYMRKQTIAGGERFITPALKEHEEKVLGADERIAEHELAIFERLRARVGRCPHGWDTARAIATLDTLAGLAETATICNYTKPHVHDGDEMLVVDGRHPVVEGHVRDAFVPNDTTLNGTTHQRWWSSPARTWAASPRMRQTALMCLLAQADRCRHARPSCRRSTGSSPAWARPTTSRGGNPRSWWRCRRRPAFSTWPLHGASSCSTRSAALRDLRWPQHRVGGGRVPWRPTRVPAEDALCHALPRAHRPRRRTAGHRQLSRGRAGMARRDRVPAEDRPGTLGSQLRDQVARLAGLPAAVVTRARF